MPECTAATLADLSKCLCGMTPQQLDWAKTYLLAVAVGENPTAANLAELSKCLCGMTPLQLKQSQTMSLCQIANAEPGNVDGLIWGPSPETVDSITDNADTTLGFLNTLTNGSSYTTLSFGNPTTVTNDVNFSGSFVLTSLAFRLLEATGGSVNVSAGAALESFSVPLLQSTGLDFNAQNITTLTSVSAPLLATVGRDLLMSGNTALVTLNLPSLASVGNDLNLDNTGIINVTLPSLVTVTNQINVSAGVVEVFSLPVLSAYPVAGITADASLLTLNLPACVDDGAGQLQTDLNVMTSLVTLNLAALTAVTGTFSVNTSPNLSSLTLTSLVTVGGAFDCASTSLVSISLPALTTITTDVTCGSIPTLTSFSAPLWVPTDGTTVDFNGDSLDIPSVEGILRRLVLAGVVACTIDLSGGTNAGTASLSAQGQADVATLGAQLTMNP